MHTEKKRKKILGKRNVIIAGAICVVVAAFFYFGGNGDEKSAGIVVQRGNVVEEVSVTGKVVPSKNIDLAFEAGGRLSRVSATVGKKVVQGEILAQLENGDLLAQIAQAEATVKAQEARLQELKRGSRPEEVAVKETELKRARQDLENYYRAARDILNDSYAKSDDAVRAKLDEMFSDDDTPNPKLTFTTSNTQAGIDVVSMRYRAGSDLAAWREELRLIDESSSQVALSSALDSGKRHLSSIRDFLTRMLDAVDGATGITATTASTYKTSIYTARTNVNASFSTLSSQEQLIASQKITIERTENELALMRAGATSEQIAAQEAQIDQANANLLYYRTQYGKTLLRAPFSGTVTKTDKNAGDIVSMNVPIVSLIGSGNFEIEANIAESDIATVKVGNLGKATLDAYGKGVVFGVRVTQIDLSETVIEGIATYKTKLQFDEADERILPGLTADVDILTGEKKDVLFVPTRNIIIDDGTYFVKKINGEETEKIRVEIGLKGSDGRTEIVSGLSEGDVISEE